MKEVENISNLEDVASDTLKILPEKQSQVIARRFAVGKKEPETLQKIGDDFGITRERVRQIQNEALIRLKSDHRVKKMLSPIYASLNDFLTDYGGLRHEEKLLKEYAVLHKDIKEIERIIGFIHLTLHLGDPFSRNKEDSEFWSHWYNLEKAIVISQKINRELSFWLKKIKKPVAEPDFFTKIKKDFNLDNQKIIFAYLEISKIIQKNNFNEWGLSGWEEISPKSVRSKAYIALKKKGTPLHFQEITKAINEFGFSPKTAKPQTVHNELIKDERFVLVGRGIYALKEWGYEPGTVKEIIESILKNSKKPISEDELVKKVLEQRKVKVNTIKINLHTHPKIKRVNEGLIFQM